MALPRGQNYVAWWRRLVGAQDQRQPELLPTLQPVILVGDHRDSIPPLNVPEGHFGFRASGAAARFPAFEIQCRAPGGALVEVEAVNDNPQADLCMLYNFSAAPVTLLAPITIRTARLPDPSRPVQTVVRDGQTSSAAPLLVFDDGYPFLWLGQINAAATYGILHGVPLHFWLPPGRCVLFEGVNAPDVIAFVRIRIREIPAIVAA